MNYSDRLTQAGFHLIKKCRCTGTLTEKYRRNSEDKRKFEINVFPEKNKFRIIELGITKTTGTLGEFENAMTAYNL